MRLPQTATGLGANAPPDLSTTRLATNELNRETLAVQLGEPNDGSEHSSL